MMFADPHHGHYLDARVSACYTFRCGCLFLFGGCCVLRHGEDGEDGYPSTTTDPSVPTKGIIRV